MFINGSFDLKTGKHVCVTEGSVYISDDANYILSTNKQSFEIVKERFDAEGISCANDIDEMHLTLFYSKSKKQLHVFSDISTSQYNFYYTVKDDILFYSTQLGKLLVSSGMERKLDIESARTFIDNGFVFGERTLISNVFKLSFSCELVADTHGKIAQNRYKYLLKKIDYKEASERYLDIIEESVLLCAKKQRKLYIPLSGGFDSNLILNTLESYCSNEIMAFTIGGKNGRNEIETVKKNVALKEKLEWKYGLVDDTFYEKLAEIVWRLEGCVFEDGVFLQYALAKLAYDSGASMLICGESSDEVQSCYYYGDYKYAVSLNGRFGAKFSFYANPFIITNMDILKKSSVMLNSFGIEGSYPFKNKKVVEYAYAIRSKNRYDKRYYKHLCVSKLPEKIIKNIKSLGGSTSRQEFISEEQAEKLSEIVAESPIIRNIMGGDWHSKKAIRTNCLDFKHIIERVYEEYSENGISGIKKMYRRVSSGSRLFMDTKKLYIILFFMIFVSGEYDSTFDEHEFQWKTSDVLGR